MAATQELAVQAKKELAAKEEKTVPARYYVPVADIYESEDALTIVMEVPGVEKKAISVNLEDNVLRVEGQIDFAKYEGFEPVYSEYNIGHFARGFTLSDKIDREGISAELDDGILKLILKKAKANLPRRIAIR